MRVISYLRAHVTLAAPWEEVRPLSGAPYELVVRALQAKYGFQATGQSAISQQIGLVTPSFQVGQFEFDNQAVAINALEFQPAGILVSSPKTEFSQGFIDDVLGFLHAQFGFRKPPRNRKKSHRTIIISDFGFDIGHTFGKWLEVQKLLTLQSTTDDAELVPLGIRFIGRNNNAEFSGEHQFVFERRLTSPPGENWIYSEAALDTDSHEGILRSIETIFKD